MTNIWYDRCQKLILSPYASKSQRNFAGSVFHLIRKNPWIYPSPAQETILRKIWAHCTRLEDEAQRSQTELDALEYLGLGA